ncbi:putative MFS family arabinose efflux permease [Streptomyces sp. 1114.5]|uniref:MFS transporter n=1 Tax=Streptomyces sp. 1114.5 TaxID=1938830 RepID=UPI000F288579|nr:MFS transporter [Streptomyces sp. 1114.5]RKT19363.1 putative MFS family arabinose efflux permease [Streptomyces sp. 1114.5]
MAEAETLVRKDGPEPPGRPGQPGQPEPHAYGSPFSPGYLGFVAANGFSAVGNSAWFVALTVVLTETASPTVTGAVLALCSLPALLGLLIGGAVVDRTGPRRVMVVADLLRCAVQAAAAVVAWLGHLSVPVFVAVLLLTNLMDAFFMPASGALRPRLLPREHLLRGNSLFLLGARGGQALGGPVGALLMGVGGAALVAGFDAVSFAVSAVAVLLLRAPAVRQAVPTAAPSPGKAEDGGGPPPEGLPARIREGLRYIRGHRDLFWLIVLIGLSELASMGPVNVGLVLLADRYGTPLGVGALLTAFTLGAVASFLISTAWPTRRRSGGMVVVGVTGQGLLLAVLGLIGSFGPAVAVYFGLGMLSGLVGNVLGSLVQRWAAPEVRGRVMSVLNMTAFTAVPVGNLMLGVLVNAVGLPATMLLHGALAGLAALIAALRPAIGKARLD